MSKFQENLWDLTFSTTTTVRALVFWDLMPCSLVDSYCRQRLLCQISRSRGDDYEDHCHDLGVTIDGVCTSEWIYWRLHTPLGTTSNYSAIANFHALQITTAPSKPFPACCVLTSLSLATASNSEGSSASRAQVLLSQPPVHNSCQLNYNNISSKPPLHSSTQLPTLN
jgi:hypothetical protein